jgi:hypothetical protein
MQDGAGIHWSHAVAAFLQRYYINTIDWPPYSPDLNPIEHLWWRLKRLMFKHFPQYNNYSRAEEEWDGFCEALKECWRRIPGKLIRRLILSMPQRLAACRKARGWQTKYWMHAQHLLQKQWNYIICWLGYDGGKFWGEMLVLALIHLAVQNFCRVTVHYVDVVFDAWALGAYTFAFKRWDFSQGLCLLRTSTQLNRAAVACSNASIRLSQD